MFTRALGWMIACSWLVAPTWADRVVREWGEANPDSWRYDSINNRIEITAADANTFSFETYDDSNNDAPMEFDRISVVGTVSGTVKVQVGPDPSSARAYGASTVKGINLLNATTGELWGLKISGDLGTLTGTSVHGVKGAIEIGESMLTSGSLGIVSQPITIGGNLGAGSYAITTLSSPLYIAGSIVSDSTLTVGTATAGITVYGEFHGTLNAGTLDDLVISPPRNPDPTMTHSGHINVTNLYDSSMTIFHYLSGTIVLQGDLTGEIFNEGMSGSVVVGGNIDGGQINLTTAGDANNSESDELSIEVKGSLIGSSSDALIYVGTLSGTIGIEKALTDANSNGAEIIVGALASGTYRRGAIAVNYRALERDVPSSGQDDAAWRNSARIQVVNAATYARDEGNSTSARVWNIRTCKGDFDNDGGAPDSTDAGLFSTAYTNALSAGGYQYDYAGLQGSRTWHGDCNFSNVFSDDGADLAAFNNLKETFDHSGCCVQSNAWCGGDLDHDFDTDISDLAILLSHFGDTGSPPRTSGNLDADGDVDIQDLATLLANFGQRCCPSSAPEPLTGGITTTVQAYDTSAYSGGGGFAGESKHFVFDVLVQMGDTDDDWIGSGVIVTTANSASFRIVPDAENPPVPTSSTPDKYATFFSQPYGNINGNSRFNSPFTSGGIAGGYSPTGSGYTYSTSTIDASWYDMNTASNDGPAAVFRLVINVENVSGADVSGGLGSVYFTTGSPGSGDIKVADMTFEVEHKYDDSGSTTVSGSFYVTD